MTAPIEAAKPSTVVYTGDLMNFITENLHYPEQCLDEGVEDIIQVSFIVEKDGSCKDFEVIDEHNPYLEAEAVRVYLNDAFAGIGQPQPDGSVKFKAMLYRENEP